MNTIRRIAPTLVVLVALMAGALVVGLAGCGQQNAPLVDNAPNADLSNEDLLKEGLLNWLALDSYHVEFAGGFPYDTVFQLRTSTNVSMTADLQQPEKGSRFAFRELSGGELYPGVPQVGSRADALISANDAGWYESYDGGATWKMMEGEVSYAGFLVGSYGCVAGSPCSEDLSDPDKYVRDYIERVELSDGSPRVEELDGVVVRHIIARPENSGRSDEQVVPTATMIPSFATIGAAFDDATPAPAPAPTEATNGADLVVIEGYEIWISTGATPTVQQWRVVQGLRDAGSTPGSTWTGTWKWSRFNEDFSEVKPPPAEKLLEP